MLLSLGGHFLKRLIAALLAPNGHFSSLLLSTLWGIQGGFTSLCVQGIFTVLRLPTVLTAEPNLPLATAAETISDLLHDAPEETKAAYARILAYGVPKLTPIDVLPLDRPKLFQADSPLLCLILTHGSVLRDLCSIPVDLQSTMNRNRAVMPVSPFSLRVLLVSAFKSSLGIANKPEQAQGETSFVNRCLSV